MIFISLAFRHSIFQSTFSFLVNIITCSVTSFEELLRLCKLLGIILCIVPFTQEIEVAKVEK